MMSEWKKFKEKMKTKRTSNSTGKNSSSGSSSTSTRRTLSKILDDECLIIQRMSAEVTGKAQKYSRIGAREFVPYIGYKEVTIENIQEACLAHFDSIFEGDHVCDVLAGEQGPSCIQIGQLPDIKVLHVRFMPSDKISLGRSSGQTIPVARSSGNCSQQSSTSTSTSTSGSSLGLKRQKSDDSMGTVSRSPSNHGQCETVPRSSNFIPKSLSLADMMKLGKVIQFSATKIDVTAFNITDMTWSVPLEVDFLIEQEPFSTGGFREAYKAKSSHKNFCGKTWVIKKYLPESMEIVKATNQTLESHTKKIVQCHNLASNMAAQFENEIIQRRVKDEFGKCFRYNKIFFGSTHTEFLTLEEFIPGTFVKYINNDAVCGLDGTDIMQKCECFMHFTYTKSLSELIVVDIQGVEDILCDPEIASRSLISGDEFLFTSGNLSQLAFQNFENTHKCNKLCRLLDLDPVVPKDEN